MNKETDKRLNEYLAKVETRHRWDQGQMLDPERGLVAERPDLTTDEARAFALGRLSAFEAAKAERLERLEDADIASVARVCLNAAASYRRDVHYHRNQALAREYDEAQARKERIVRRWQRQEAERGAERKEHVWDRLGGKRMPPGVDTSAAQPHEARGGFAEHAKRETALEAARRYTAGQQPRDSSPDRD